MWPCSSTGKWPAAWRGPARHAGAGGPLGIPVRDRSGSGLVSGSAFACSVPARGRSSRPIAGRGPGELLRGPRCPVAPIAVPELPLGRYVMSRLAGFYIAKAIESAAGGTTEAAASRTPPRRAVDHAALDATSSHDRSASILQLVAAAVHRIIGGLGKASRGHRRLNHLRVPPREPARQPSAR